MNDHSGQGIPADMPLPATAERALADLRDRYGRCYQFRAFWTLRFTATRREEDDLSPFLDEGSAEELLGQIRGEYAWRHEAGLPHHPPAPRCRRENPNRPRSS